MNYKTHPLMMMLSTTSIIFATDISNSHIPTDGIGETYISGQSFINKKVYYSIKDDLAIFEGDILLGNVDEAEKWREVQENNNYSRAQIIKGARYRWPNGIIPYTIASNVSSRTQTLITRAIAHITERTSIRFVPKTSQYPNYINMNSTTQACYANVGDIQRGKQNLNVYEGCGFGGIVHELTHAIGLWHEQSRVDRNQFVRINWQNIRSGQEHNFNQHITDGVDIASYDYNSIMHYNAYSFSKNSQPTITPLQAGVHIGQRNGLSQGDIAAINTMYPNNNAGVTSSSTSWTTGSYNNNQDISRTLSIPGAHALTVKVSGTTENNYDYIYIYDANGNEIRKLDGNINTSFTVNSASIRARLVTDHSVTKSGVTISISRASNSFNGGGGGNSTSINYEFNTVGSAEGWSYANMIQQYGGPYNRAWFFACNQNDPIIISPGININTQAIKKIQIRIANNNPSSYSKLQVFWKRNGQGFSETNSQRINISNHGGWSTYTIDLSHNPRWNGTINQIRIDPVLRGDGSWIAIDYIRLRP